MDAARLLLQARTKARLSQRELGRRAGVSQAAVARIEEGKASPRFETLDRLLAACGFEVDLVPKIGIGIDRTGMRALMDLNPAERARRAAEEAHGLEKLLRSLKP